MAAGGGWRLVVGGWWFGCWRLVARGWRLAAGSWRLAAGGWRRVVRVWRLGAGGLWLAAGGSGVRVWRLAVAGGLELDVHVAGGSGLAFGGWQRSS